MWLMLVLPMTNRIRESRVVQFYQGSRPYSQTESHSCIPAFP
uniref:Uncharacterized protein n=1 Tax=Anguilla anguilla TaxID=7936 RepID=A0A0E9UAF4_ANGAN